MARQGLHQHRKFLRLADRLGGVALARGVLEMLWEPAYDSADDFLGDAADIHLRCGRPAGLTAEGLAGALFETGFIDEDANRPAQYRIHDLFDHAPDAVAKRATREAERMARGKTLSQMRAEFGRKGGRISKRKQMKTFASGHQANVGGHQANVGSPQANLSTPTPTPSPSPSLKRLVEQGSTDARVAEVFEHWKRKLEHPKAILDGKREKAILARLREGLSVEDLKQAIDGCALTPHNMGQNDQQERYDDLELICRSTGQVERFMRNAQAPPGRHETEFDLVRD